MKTNKAVIPIIAVILGFLAGALVMLATGHNPITAYAALLKGAGFHGDIKRIGDTILNTTPLILTGLSVAFAFRTGLFNIGASGQMLIGGMVAVFLGVQVTLPRYLHVPLCVIGAMMAGALWGFIPGLLKAKYKINEVVTTIMLNYIAQWTVYYLVPKYIPGNFNTDSKIIKETASLRTEFLTKLFKGSYVNMGLFIALISAIVVWFIIEKTTFGYELKAVGYNISAAQYSGMKVRRSMILSMMIAGALAGLAGATYYIGYANNIKIGVLPSQGPDGIAVALLGLNTPIGVVMAALLFGVMNSGRLFMQSSTDVPNELVPIIIATIIFFAATSLMIEVWVNKAWKAIGKKGDGK